MYKPLTHTSKISADVLPLDERQALFQVSIAVVRPYSGASTTGRTLLTYHVGIEPTSSAYRAGSVFPLDYVSRFLDRWESNPQLYPNLDLSQGFEPR